jgi:hypothetical protein
LPKAGPASVYLARPLEVGEIRRAGISTRELRANVIIGNVIHPFVANIATRARYVPGRHWTWRVSKRWNQRACCACGPG